MSLLRKMKDLSIFQDTQFARFNYDKIHNTQVQFELYSAKKYLIARGPNYFRKPM